MGLGFSAYTSVNKDKVPQLFTWAVGKGLIRPGDFVFDLGCGRWPETTKGFLRENGVDVIDQWDPNWFPDADYVPIEGYDVVCLSNVLNVIGDRAERIRALKMAWDALRPGGVMLVTVYEAEGDGASGPSKDGCWQERRKLRSYAEDELACYFGAIIPGTRLWASIRKPGKGERWIPPVGTKLSLCFLNGSSYPYTVVGMDRGQVVIREARLEFDGPRYYDTVADRIVPGLPGDREERLIWHPKAGDWHGRGKYGGYVRWCEWTHQPNLD